MRRSLSSFDLVQGHFQKTEWRGGGAIYHRESDIERRRFRLELCLYLEKCFEILSPAGSRQGDVLVSTAPIPEYSKADLEQVQHAKIRREEGNVHYWVIRYFTQDGFPEGVL